MTALPQPSLAYSTIISTRGLGFVVGIAAALLHVRHAEVLRVWFHGSKLCIPMTLVATFAVLYPFVEQFLINDTQIRLISSRIIAHPMLNFGLGFWILSPTSRLRKAQSMARKALIEPSALCHRAAFLLDVSLSHSHHLGVYQGLVAHWPDISVAMVMLVGGIISFPLTLITSTGVYLFVERPGIALRSRLRDW